MSEPRTDATEAKTSEVTEHRPRPTPTGRARRAAATAVGSQTGTEGRRPSPRPSGTAAPVSLTKPGDTERPDRPDRPGRSAKTPRGLKRNAPAAPAAVPATTRHSSGARAPLWLGLLVAVLAVIGVAAVVVALVLPVDSGSTGERDQALAAAKSEVPLILSYDYKNFDADLAKGKTVLTGAIVGDYSKAMTTSIKPSAVKLKASVQATTDSGGVESVSPDGKQVVVLVFGEQKVTNSSLSAPRVDLMRVRATMNLVHGHWLVSKFDPI